MFLLCILNGEQLSTVPLEKRSGSKVRSSKKFPVYRLTTQHTALSPERANDLRKFDSWNSTPSTHTLVLRTTPALQYLVYMALAGNMARQCIRLHHRPS
jgi:hypothetical protein